MKSVLLLLLSSSVNSQPKLPPCLRHEDCPANFSKMQSFWQKELSSEPDLKPVEGDQKCGSLRVAGYYEGEGYHVVDVKTCVNTALCTGWAGEIDEIRIFINSCPDIALKVGVGILSVMMVLGYTF